MRPFPAATALAPWLGALALAASCGTDARGIEDCRAIENARCDAAKACGSLDDAAACKRFYRDQCLHGLSVASPGSPATDACVGAIEQITACASAAPDTEVAACSRFRTPTLACGFVQTPELLKECNFLTPNDPPAAEGGAGGEASTDGGTTGMGGVTSSGGAAANGGASVQGGTPGSGGALDARGGAPSVEGGAPSAEGGSAPIPVPEGGSSGTSNEGDGGSAGAGAGGVSGADTSS